MADNTDGPTGPALCGVEGDFTEALAGGLFRTEPVSYGPCQNPATEQARFICERGHFRERIMCPAHVDVLTRPADGDAPFCVMCFQATGEAVPLAPLVEAPNRDRATQWWRCPNTPPCPHPGVLHDIEELGDPSPTCCVEDCRCGRAADRPTAYWIES